MKSQMTYAIPQRYLDMNGYFGGGDETLVRKELV